MLACSHARMRAQQEVALERMCRKKERRRRNERGEERKERERPLDALAVGHEELAEVPLDVLACPVQPAQVRSCH